MQFESPVEKKKKEAEKPSIQSRNWGFSTLDSLKWIPR